MIADADGDAVGARAPSPRRAGRDAARRPADRRGDAASDHRVRARVLRGSSSRSATSATTHGSSRATGVPASTAVRLCSFRCATTSTCSVISRSIARAGARARLEETRATGPGRGMGGDGAREPPPVRQRRRSSRSPTTSPRSTTTASSRARCGARSSAPAATSQELSLVMIDVDNLKAYNDRNGHLRGSFLLRELAGLFAAAGALVRPGGEVRRRRVHRDPAADRPRRRAWWWPSACAPVVEAHTFPLAAPGSITVSIGRRDVPAGRQTTDRASIAGLPTARLYLAKQQRPQSRRRPSAARRARRNDAAAVVDRRRERRW